jgi:hypothetical protein
VLAIKTLKLAAGLSVARAVVCHISAVILERIRQKQQGNLLNLLHNSGIGSGKSVSLFLF